MKTYLEYDPDTGMVTDKLGATAYAIISMEGFKFEGGGDGNLTVDQLNDLKQGGYSVDEIIELRKKGLI